MRVGFEKWWLVPLGILAASTLVTLGIIVLEPSLIGRSTGEVARQSASEPATDCSGALSSDYACHQERYQNLVRTSGVEAAFAELKDEHEKNEFVKSNCHQLVHVIGRAAAERYGDLSTTYAQGDQFCFGGYYHGVMETIAARIGPDKILEKADTLCADLREDQRYSVYHHECAHGLGHGFMGVYENELFESLKACDALTDLWESNACYSGVFMENIVARDNPSHPSKYLKADQPLYPCTDVARRYKTACYQQQTSYALKTQGNDFARVFDLCESEEDEFGPACYRGLGGAAAQQSISDVGSPESASKPCMLGEDHEARFNCVVEAATYFVHYYRSDEQAKTFCESLDADLRAECLRATEEYYGRF
jgi:hypothetical protein